MMQFTQPKLAQRGEQYYVGVRTRVPMQELDSVIPPCVDEAAAWLATQTITPTPHTGEQRWRSGWRTNSATEA